MRWALRCGGRGRLSERRLLLLEGGLQERLELVSLGAGLVALLGRKGAEAAQELGKGALAPQVDDAPVLQVLGTGHLVQGLEGLVSKG